MPSRKYPAGAAVFRDGPARDCDYLIGVGVSPDEIEVMYVPKFTQFGWTNWATCRYGGDNPISGLRFLKPLNADARAMLAIARSGK